MKKKTSNPLYTLSLTQLDTQIDVSPRHKATPFKKSTREM